jgi:hypothetical protein
MRFSDNEIEWAGRLRGRGLAWDPQPGHYAFDIDGIVKAPSPFQAGVYLINSPNEFASHVGGEAALLERFTWLPTFEDAVDWLREAGIDDDKILDAWRSARDEGRTELEAVYRLMLEILDSDTRHPEPEASS